MSDPIVVTATFVPNPGRTAEVLEVLRTTIPKVHEEPGCELYAINEAEDGALVMIELWTTEELLNVHGSSPAVLEQRAGLAGMLAEPVDVRRYRPVPIGEERKGSLLR